MTTHQINKAYDRIIGSLDNREVKGAFDFLQGLIASTQEYSFQDKLNELQNTYKYMLRYRMEGANDPMQEQIYFNLLASIYELADQVKHKTLAVESPLAYYERRRSLSIRQATSYENLHLQLSIPVPTLNTQAEYENSLILLFQQLWVSGALLQEEVSAIRNIIMDDQLPITAGCQVTSALMLGLQTSFDKEKLFLLFDAANHPEDEIRIRAIIGILLTLSTYRKRTYLYPQIAYRLAALSEQFPVFCKVIRTITQRFILARDTDKIARELQNEIIPEMMKFSPEISKKMSLKDFTPEQLGNEMNPEWQEMLSNTTLGKKMEQFSELQKEGADIMHSTFIHLKSFPFFQEVSNWFMPFTINHSLFGDHFEQPNSEKRILDSMTGAAFMCNSDKYSLYFSMMKLQEQHRNMVIHQFDGQVTEMIQESKEELINKRGKLEIITGQYIQDLYRFFKVYPGHLDFDDIFILPLDFHNLPILQPYISDEESLLVIAEFYLRKNYFSDALTIYRHLISTNQSDNILFQKIGYCKQMNGDIEGALEAYLRADLLNSESKWVIRRIATCYRTLKQPEKALQYYHRYEVLNPDNLSVEISIGHCHLELKNYNEALKSYFKVDYLDNKSHKAWRPIAWCSFLTGKYDQARNYYKKILDNQPNMQDLLNAGHTEWALQNMKGTLACYKRAVQMESQDFNKFQEQFNQDIPDLLVAGIEEIEIPLMMDQLRYALADLL